MKFFVNAVACVMAISVTLTASATDQPASEATLPMVNQIVLLSLDDAQNKILQLADAIPEEKYGYKPMEGVANVGDVLMHLAGANYYIANMLGNSLPEGIDPRTIGEGVDKAGMIAIYRASVSHVHAAISMIDEEAMAEVIDFWGMTAPRARLALIVADHNHEHLGQLIAYARANEIVPPWSR